MTRTAPAVRDAVLAVSLVVIGGFCFVQLDTAESITQLLAPWERHEPDDLLLTSALAVLASCWFALRRWREAAQALRAREQSERDKARYVERLLELSSQLLETEQDERARLADLLHDEVGQTLYACRLQLESLRPRLTEPALRKQLEHADALASAAMTYTRDLTVDLRPPVLHDLGLPAALAWLVDRSQQRWQLPVQLIASPPWQQIPPAWYDPVFQSVSELLANAAKHAEASQVELTAADGGNGWIHISVTDNGKGFDWKPPSQRGFGLFSIERRIACLGGELKIASTPGSGTSATLELPCGH
jgi:signal transduction histidine kinase